MKCVEILEGDNKGKVIRVTDEQASVMVQKTGKARYVPKSRYRAILKGVDRMDKIRD